MIDDTIAALSTPVGEGGIAIIRISGGGAIAIADQLYSHPAGDGLVDAASHTIHYGHIESEGARLDEVLVSVMRAPRTYTREDVIEIHAHGGTVAARAILDAVLVAGARLAERGEFTRRAFVNGRISLDQAKAVLDIVRARTALGLEAAVDRLGGRFSDALGRLRADLVEILADLEVEIDYPDLDVELDAVLPRIRACAERVHDLLVQSESGRLIREGLTIAIIGRPNVGKSTLLNALLAEERAIVTPIPGTTRDTIEEDASLDGIPVRWIDTAGLREADHPVEAEGVRRTRNAMDRADLLLLLIDRSEPMEAEDEQILSAQYEIPAVLVFNKCDLADRFGELPPGDWSAHLDVSAKTGHGIAELKNLILNLMVNGALPTRNSALLLDSWERDLLRRVSSALKRADAVGTGSGATPDMIAEELRIAYTVAGELQGIDVPESILDAVFSRFCVGK